MTHANSCFCTSSNKITTFYKKFSAFFPRHFVPYLSFWSLSLFCHKPEFFVIFMQILYGISCKHSIRSFYWHRFFFIFFQIFFIITLDVGGGRNLSAHFEMKLNQEINWAWNQKILIFLVWCDNFWDTFTLGTTSNKKLYDQKLSQNICRRLPEP